MNKLLGTNVPLGHTKLTPPNWTYIHDIVNNGILETKQFYQENKQFTLSGHPLITYLQTLPISINLPFIEFANGVLSLSIDKTRNFGFTSSLSAGDIHHNVFFGNGSKEIIIAVDSKPWLLNFPEIWKEVSCLKTVRHPYSHLFYQVGETGPISRTKGLSIVMLDVVLLALKWKCFYDEENARVKLNGGLPLGVNHFVKAYVLPDMIRSNLDYSIFNIYKNTVTGVSNTINTFRLPFNISSVDKEIKDISKYIIRILSNSGRVTGELLSNVTTTNGNIFQHFHLTDQTFLCRQNTWAYFLAVLPALEYSYTLGGLRGVKANSREINRVIEIIRRLEGDKSFQQNNLNTILPEVQMEIEGIRQSISR